MVDPTSLVFTFITAAIAAFVGAAAYGAFWQAHQTREPTRSGIVHDRRTERRASRPQELRTLRLHNDTANTLNIYTEPLPETYHVPPGLAAELSGVDLEFDGGLDIQLGTEPPCITAIVYAGADVVVAVSGKPLMPVRSDPFPLSDALVGLPPLTPDLVEAIKDSGVTKRSVAALRDAYRALIRPQEQAPRAAFLQELLDRWD